MFKKGYNIFDLTNNKFHKVHRLLMVVPVHDFNKESAKIPKIDFSGGVCF